jgi:hypothetical protein
MAAGRTWSAPGVDSELAEGTTRTLSGQESCPLAVAHQPAGQAQRAQEAALM